jgi:DUF971 family protein
MSLDSRSEHAPILQSVENHLAQAVLALHFADGTVARLTHAGLRGACPCSECRALRRAGQVVEAAPGVVLEKLEPVGLYALNLTFSDGHRRGIYPFSYLVELDKGLVTAL